MRCLALIESRTYAQHFTLLDCISLYIFILRYAISKLFPSIIFLFYAYSHNQISLAKQILDIQQLHTNAIFTRSIVIIYRPFIFYHLTMDTITP